MDRGTLLISDKDITTSSGRRVCCAYSSSRG